MKIRCFILNRKKVVTVSSNDKLSELITLLKEGSFQMSAPTLTTTINGKQKTLYLEKIAKTHDNLNKKLGRMLIWFGHLFEIQCTF